MDSGQRAQAVAISSPGVDNSGQIAGVQAYLGYNLFNDSADTRAVVTIRQGHSGGKILDTVALAAGESARAWYGPEGIEVEDSLAIVIVSGGISNLSTLRIIPVG